MLFVGNYPNPVNENLYIFFRNLIFAMADLGIECYVISPVSITKYRKQLKLIPLQNVEFTRNGNKIRVYYPRFISASSKNIGPFRTMYITHRNYLRVVLSATKKLGLQFDAVYGHFFLSGGLAASYVGEKLNIPAFVAYGESSYETQVTRPYGSISKKEINGLSGIISVSQKNTEELEKAGIYTNIPIFTCENAVDMSLFGKCSREEAREKFGLPQDKFVVGFVGGFIERKGDKRLLAACQDLEGVYLAFAGQGENPPKGERVVFCQGVSHNEIGDFLAAIDVFALPTLNEGCCNAVLEAMAAGKAIISSDLPFNDNVLTNENSIRINPNSIDDIRKSVIKLRDDAILREKLGRKAKENSRNFTIEKRAEKIIEFIRRNL